MSTVRRNTIANYAGQAWSALMSLAFVPVYIAYIGIEAYGIIGFFVALQSLFTILDLGISAALNRELARRSGQHAAPGETRDLLRTMEWLYWPMGVVIALAIWIAAAPLARHWLKLVELSADDAAQALLLLGVAAALQWPVALYTGGLSGLQRQVLLNAVAAVFATVRALGAVAVLAVVPTIHAFLWWQVALSAAQTVVYAWLMWRALPPAPLAAAFSRAELRKVQGFAIGITGVTLLSFLLTQTDRIVLSKVLPLDEFGVYAFAASAALAVFRLVYPVVSAVYPRYSQLVAAGDSATLVGFYHRTNQVMAAIVLPAAAVIAGFPREILWLWTGNAKLAAAAAPILALLACGTALNGLMNLPYALQLAYGWTRLAFWMNIAAVCFVVPAVWIAGRAYGGTGAAAVWLILNTAYLVLGIPIMHVKLIPQEMGRWYLHDVLPPLAASAAVVIAWRLASPEIARAPAGFLILLVVAASASAAAVAASQFPRSVVQGWWARWRLSHG